MHLYLHVPFCARRCSYCDFAIAVRREIPAARYVGAVSRELASGAAGVPFETVYFGGGTPSRLPASAIAELLERIDRVAGITPAAEVTLEANPDDVTPVSARAWRAAGVNRVSLGAQSHQPAVLEWMHRTHRAEQVPEAINTLRAAGIGNVSVDLIFALPDEIPRDWARDLEATLALAPAHVSLYGLTVEAHTPLARWTARGAVGATPDDRYAAEYLLAHRALVAAGFDHYEVSNAARPGHRSRHNGAYWTGADYVGVGPSAHGKRGSRRSWNIREWAAYVAASEAGLPVEAGFEVLDLQATRIERLYLGLRTDAGVPASLIPAASRAAWLASGWAREHADRVVLTAEGWLRLDALVGALGDS